MSAILHTPVPDIPGEIVDMATQQALMSVVNPLLGLDYNFSRYVFDSCADHVVLMDATIRFPGSQPVSFVSRSLRLLENRK
jgi:hypothetical protein